MNLYEVLSEPLDTLGDYFGQSLDSHDPWPYPFERIGDLYVRAGLPRYSDFGLIRHSLGTTLHDPKRCHMAVWAYFDASGTDVSTSILTLGGVAMQEAELAEFESKWKEEVLGEFGIQAVHMSKMMYSATEEFHDWDDVKKRELLSSAFNVLGGFVHRSLHGMACSIAKADHEECNLKHPGLFSMESICVNFCVSNAGVDEDDKLYLFFDRNEEFRKKIYPVWEKRRKLGVGWASQIEDINEIDSEKAPLLQAADILAWTTRRKHEPAGLPAQWSYLGDWVSAQSVERFYDAISLDREAQEGKIIVGR